jgi:ubiquinone/menaquinone biosynthesis C-methylase UbiE
MRDIIQNRARIGLSTKARLLGLSMKENGPIWTLLIGIYYVASAIAETAFAWADQRRHHHSLPGMNSPAMNKVIWENWDWRGAGEEWSSSPEWKESVINVLLRPNMPQDGVVVEIGPGGGRWTSELQRRAKKLIGIDISAACVRECRERFTGCDNVEFVVGSGSDLKAVASASADAIWSFDVFVHINRPQFKAYAAEFARVLKVGGKGVVHHGSVAGKMGGWRSDVTEADVRDFLGSEQLEITDQISSWWENGKEHKFDRYNDVVTVFRKPSGRVIVNTVKPDYFANDFSQ